MENAIVPVAPRFLPAITTTLSPFLSFIYLNNLWSKSCNFLITSFHDFTRNRTEHAICLRLFLLLLHQNHRVFVEANVRAVFSTKCFLLADDNSAMNVFLLHRLSRLSC